jgi:hypothetical protein
MIRGRLRLIATLGATFAAGWTTTTAQSPPGRGGATPPAHSVADPRDLSGLWTNATMTPLERPAELAGKAFFTAAEAAAYEKQMRERNDADRRDSNAEADLAVGYNAIWWDRGTTIVPTRRTSLVTDPSDGRIPPLTPEAQRKAATRAEARRLHPADGPEDASLADRCVVRGTAGPPMLPAGYNNNYQIVQTPDHVAIIVEMIHDVRIVPLDARPHISEKIRQWVGDSRGHWEGNTLIVETTNFTDRTNFRGSGESLRVTERFTRTDPDTLLYQFTVTDPQSFVRPWSGELPMKKTDGPLFEYACHEGNYSMTNTLSTVRDQEQGR